MLRQSKHQESWPSLHLRHRQEDMTHLGRGRNRTRLNIQNHLHRFFPEGYHRVEPSEIEIVFDKIFCDLAEVIMAG